MTPHSPPRPAPPQSCSAIAGQSRQGVSNTAGRLRQAQDTGARGMTLVEVLAVVVILALLAGTLTVGFSGAFGKGKVELAKTGIGVLADRVLMYELETSKWPNPTLGLSVLTDGVASPTAPYYIGPDAMIDPWNNEFVLIVPGPDGKPFEIVSYGSDGQPGGEGDAADISSLNLKDR